MTPKKRLTDGPGDTGIKLRSPWHDLHQTVIESLFRPSPFAKILIMNRIEADWLCGKPVGQAR